MASALFESLIHRPMMRQNKVRLCRQMQTPTRADPPFRQPLNFFDQARWIDHRSARNQAGNFPSQNSRRNKMQHVLFLADLHRMPRIIPPLRA